MRRIVIWSCAAAAALLAAPGCSYLHREPANPTVLPPAKVRELVQADRERLAGPDSPRHQSHTFFGVDVTGESPWMAIGHVLWAVPQRLINFATGETPVKYATMMENTRSPDARREGVLKLADYPFGRKDPYVKRYDQIAGRDGDYLVRAAAIRALNRSRSRQGGDVYLAAMDDAEPAVRLEAAKALANVPIDAAAPKLIAHLQRDPSKDVRIACADALRNVKTLDSARALMSVLNDREFGVSWQARRSLILMTGHDYRYDESAWLDYVAKAGTPFI
jgi:hypothetical protein